MKLLLKILGTIAIIIGVGCVLGGISSSSMDSSHGGISAVLGGGFFMALGIAIFQLNKQP